MLRNTWEGSYNEKTLPVEELRSRKSGYMGKGVNNLHTKQPLPQLKYVSVDTHGTLQSPAAPCAATALPLVNIIKDREAAQEIDPAIKKTNISKASVEAWEGAICSCLPPTTKTNIIYKGPDVGRKAAMVRKYTKGPNPAMK